MKAIRMIPVENYKEKFTHHNNRRKRNHDYRAPWKYHITVVKTKEAPDFCSISIKELKPDGVSVVYSSLGKIIENAVWNITKHNPKIKVLQYIIMPDHVHILIEVISRLEKPIGNEIGGFKTGISNTWRNLVNDNGIKVFETGFNDKIIYPDRNLDDVFKYIQQNPYRLAVRRMRPDFFQKQRNIFVDGREIQAYGNLFHFRNPFKYALVVHRNDSEAQFFQKLEDCIYYAANGGIVVSAFISPREKEIRKCIEEIGGKIMLINNRPIEDRGKPARHDFDLCSQGNLLIVSAMDYLSLPKTEHPSRSQCLDMNSLAIQIAKFRF